jgi:ubiquinone biosynthesis protein
MNGAKKHRIKITNNYTLMGKSILTIEGIGRVLDPELDLEKEVEPFVLKLVQEKWYMKKLGNDFYKRGSQFYDWSYDSFIAW